MIVAGGIYYERCLLPDWSRLLGSGGRAAVALSGFESAVELHSFAPEFLHEQIQEELASTYISVQLYPSTASYVFSYFHALSSPTFYTVPNKPVEETIFEVSGEAVIRFGMMEGSARVVAKYAVYDPQSSHQLFTANGSHALHLVYVLNEGELFEFLPNEQDLDAAARHLLKMEGAEAVVVKRGVFGVRVVTSAVVVSIPAFQTTKVFKIGSGDIFTAAFAHQWAKLMMPMSQAAEIASRSAAWYCDSRSLELPDTDLLQKLTPVTGGNLRQIYLAAPFFTISQRWLVEETKQVLERLGGRVFSPLHEVGFGEANSVAPADLAAIQESGVVLALIDGVDLGTIFEIGYAHAYQRDVLALNERLPDYQVTMLSGSPNCEVETDYATAMYKAIWKSMS